MDRVHCQSERSIEDVRYAGVAIRHISDGQRHIGVLHASADSPLPNLLHLAWHLDLRNDIPGEAYRWIDPPLPSPRLRQIAAMCRRIWSANPSGIPYGFEGPTDCFDAVTHEALFGPTKTGLTCATFVLAVFRLCGIELIDLSTWPEPDKADLDWQESIVAHLKGDPRNIPHCNAVKAQIGAARVRPEHAAASAALNTGVSPTTYELLVDLSSTIVQQLAEKNTDPC